MKTPSHLRNILILVLLSLIILMAGNGILNLTNPDEVFYAQTAKEMAQNNTWMVPYLFGQPNFEKPIFTYWLIRWAYLMFGVTSFSARLFPAIFAIIGVISVYLLAFWGLKDERKAFLSALILMSSGLYVGLSRTVFTDMVFSVLILLSLTAFFWGYADRKRKGAGLILFFVFSGLAVLAKGPLGFILPLLTILVFLAARKELKFLSCAYSVWGLLICCAIALPWYVFMLKKFDAGFIREFLYNDHIRRLFEAEHRGNDTWYFYPLSALLCMFPWTVFVACALWYFIKHLRQKNSRPIDFFILAWILIVFAVFQSAHSKLVSYILPLFPALAIVTGDFLESALRSGRRLILVTSLLSWLFFALFPVALLIASEKHAKYISSKAPIYAFIAVYLILVAAMLFFIIKRRFPAYFFLVFAQIPLILSFVFAAHENFDKYASSRDSCVYLLKNYNINTTLLCSKILVRGVRFFSDKEVAVINVAGSNFFSPHPVLYLDTDEKVKDFLQGRPVTYCVLARSSFKNMLRISAEYGFTMDELKLFGNEYLVKISHK